jgi:urease subunit gamma/beta
MARMHLTPREEERILLSAAADLARRRLARGARLGAAESVALLCDEICELAWDGVALEQIVERAPRIIPAEALLDGVAAAVPRLEVEALFPHGTSLVHVDAPFGKPAADSPGSVRTADGPVELAASRPRKQATLRNHGRLPIWVSSHVPLSQVNRALEVSPPECTGYRLDLPAGAAIKVDPGEDREVAVVAVEGAGR